MSCAWIDCIKAFDCVPRGGILRSLELFKISSRVVGFLNHNMKNWKTQLSLTHKSSTLMSDNINIKRGIFRGDSLSALLFCISFIPISLELNSSVYECKIRTGRITHMFYMDDLKQCAKDDSELEGFLITVKRFRDDIGMEFWSNKCANGTFKRGKLEKPDHIPLYKQPMIGESLTLALMSLMEFNSPQRSKI